MTRPAQTPWGEVIPLHRGAMRETTVERVYREQGRKFSDQPIDLRVNQLKLRVHPPIPVWQVVVMLVVAAAIGVMLAVQL
jgi:hypothetical protein